MVIWKVFIYPFILCAIYNNVAHASVCNSTGDPDAVSQILLKVYTGNGNDSTYIQSTVTNPEILRSYILPDRDTVMYVHGYMGSGIDDTVRFVPRAYLESKNVNFILGDYGKIARHFNYLYVASNVPAVGKAYATALNALESVINATTFHIVGHSIGAHIGAHIARFLNTRLHRLTGLDPAGPLFYPSTCHIRPNDADIVVAVHTDPGRFGTNINTAAIDFWANQGVVPQPGCSLIHKIETAALDVLNNSDICTNLFLSNRTDQQVNCTEYPWIEDNCNHMRAVLYFTESLANPTAFQAIPCRNTAISNSDVVYFGDAVQEGKQGVYCFSTNAQSPYSKTTGSKSSFSSIFL